MALLFDKLVKTSMVSIHCVSFIQRNILLQLLDKSFSSKRVYTIQTRDARRRTLKQYFSPPHYTALRNFKLYK